MIKDIEKIRAIDPDFNFSKYGIIKSIKISHDVESSINIEFVLSGGDFDINILFESCSQVKLGCFENESISVHGFDVRDISSNKWEDKKWEIIDYEDDLIHFYCNKVSIIQAIEA